jgi:prephenate dehydrogenase
VRVALLGLGLIGGSIARALRRERPNWTLVAWSPSGADPTSAAAGGAIDLAAASPEAAVDGADLIVLAAPPRACLDLVDALAGPLRDHLAPSAIVTDVASTKAAILERADRHGLRFVGGHPMAGRETSGFDAADADLFCERPWVIVPGARAGADDVARVEQLASACGARPVRLSAIEHDVAVAAVSHLPLVLSAALVEAVAGGDPGEPGGGDGSARPDWAAAAGLAAGGWQGMTRLARGDAEMGAGIAATNAGPIADRIRDLREVLDDWLAELERPGGPDERRLAARLAAARRRLEEAG